MKYILILSVSQCQRSLPGIGKLHLARTVIIVLVRWSYAYTVPFYTGDFCRPSLQFCRTEIANSKSRVQTSCDFTAILMRFGAATRCDWILAILSFESYIKLGDKIASVNEPKVGLYDRLCGSCSVHLGPRGL